MVRANVVTEHDACKISVQGEMDISNLNDLSSPIDSIMQRVTDKLIVDLYKVTYIDSAILEVIVRTRNKLAKKGCKLQVTTRSESQPDRVLRTCRFDTILDLNSVNGTARQVHS